MDRNQYAESERLAAERLLEETLDLLKETKIRTKQVIGPNRTGHMISRTGQDRTNKFAGLVLLDWTKSGIYFYAF